MPTVETIDPERLAEIVDVHCDAFRDYPTMRYVLGPDTEDYDRRLARLIGLFLDATHLKGGTFFGIRDEKGLAAAADAVRSDGVAPSRIAKRRRETWKELGEACRARYEAYSAITATFPPDLPHYYLSMLGVRPRSTGRGLARPLLEAVHALSAADPLSSGVVLETEDPANVSLYEHFGYEIVGHAKLEGGVESWGFFRPDPPD